ncbi:DEAD/DEAH box helicase [Bacillus taeanensis]|uniref:Helicase n=1 Tax=Bacillus taeanensis TaxID=273032 RepID=A0A366XVL9_9BACI|nr:AAA domain-containing protein [Bacillus taeanensis]RBW69195.1 helicase [Bacillus taeanensis]
MTRTIGSFLFEWNRALAIELNYLQENGGERYILPSGELLAKSHEEYVYHFHTTAELYVPDSSPVRIVYKEREVKGEVIASEGRSLYVKISDFLGNSIEGADLYNEPWQLLESLIDRLKEIKEDRQKLRRVKRLMTGEAPVNHLQKTIKNDQHEALLRSFYNATTYIWGPPGTGKTYTLSRIAANHYRKGKKVLVLSHSNAAVDVLMLEIAKYVKKKQNWHSGDIVRYGFSRNEQMQESPDLLSAKLIENNYPTLFEKQQAFQEERKNLIRRQTGASRMKFVDEHLHKISMEIKKLEQELLEDAQMIGSTLSKTASDRVLYKKEYDLVIVDEISMAYAPQIAFAASLGKRVVVCGDFKQLPPIALADHPYVNQWLKEDLFYQTGMAQKTEKGIFHPHLFMLTKQRRMHQDISAFTNRIIYKGKVSNHKSVIKKQEVANKKPFAKEAALLLNMSNLHAYGAKDSTTGSHYNLVSVLLSMSLILKASKSGIDSIGYVTPYKAQANLMNSLIKEILPNKHILAATVHKFQGSERDSIIFDVVDSFPETRPGMLIKDEKSDRLINVAVTRSRGKFIAVADESFLKKRLPKERALSKLFTHFKNQNSSYQSNQFLRELIQHQKLIWYKPKDDKQMIGDLEKVKKSVLLSIPFASKISDIFWEKIKHKNLEITIFTKEPHAVNLSAAKVIPSSFPYSIMLLDDKVLWLNMPYADHKQILLAARVHAPEMISLLVSYLDFNPEEIIEQTNEIAITSNKINYSLTKYLSVWERCSDCNSVREAEVTKRGKVRLICHYCGGTGGVTRFILQRYIDFVELSCKRCSKPLEAVSSEETICAKCPKCAQIVEPRELV